MKKIFCLILALCVLMSTFTVNASFSDKRDDLGFSFSLPDGWYKESSGDSYYFYNTENVMEYAAVEVIRNYPAYSIELVSDAELKKICTDVYNDNKLAKELSDLNGISVKIITTSEVTGYEYYNGVKYYRYEKAYTASADDFDDTSLYETMFITVRNGRMYRISYKRDDQKNHFANILSLINSISYQSGEIKIYVNNDKITPDSAPLIVEGRTIVPIRAVAEKMGYSVQWSDKTKTVTLISAIGDTTLQFTIGNNIAIKNSAEALPLDVPAKIYSDRTYLPLRAVAEAMSADVAWNDTERAVYISK